MNPVYRIAMGLMLMTALGCAGNAYTSGGYRSGDTRQMDRDYMECEYKSRLANQEQFYNQHSPVPFGGGPQSPVDRARALHGLSTMNAMRDTCLAAKGYRVE